MGAYRVSWMEKHRANKEWRGVDLRNGHVDGTTRLRCPRSMAGCFLVQEMRHGPQLVTSQGDHMAWGGVGTFIVLS